MKNYTIEISSFVSWTFVGYLALRFYSRPSLNFILYEIILVASHFVWVFVRGKDTDFVYFPFLSYKEHTNWIGNGIFQYVNSVNAFQITDSHNGFIYSKTFNWVNYEATLQFKIVQKSLSVIVRATDLSNYIMFQIFEKEIKPHIKVNALWVCYDPKREKIIPFIELAPITPVLTKDKWYYLKIVCDQNLITILISFNGNSIFERTWAIPPGSVLFTLKSEPPADIPFPINLDYGTFGLRNDATEIAFIKDLLVKKRD